MSTFEEVEKKTRAYIKSVQEAGFYHEISIMIKKGRVTRRWDIRGGQG